MLLIVAIALRIPGMFKSIWYDEVWRTKLVLRPGNLREVLLHDVHNPLYNAAMYVWIALVGDSEWAIRLPSLVASVLAAAAFSWWVAGRFGHRAGWWTATFLACSPFHIWHSTEAKNNAVLSLFVVVAFVAGERLVRADLARALRWGAVLGLASVAAVATSWSALPALVAAFFAAALVGAKSNRIPVGPSEASADPAGAGYTALRLGIVLGLVVAVLSPLVFLKVGQIPTLMRAHPRHFEWREVTLFVGNFLMFGNAIRPVQAYAVAEAFADRLVLTLCQATFAVALLAIGTAATLVRSRVHRGAIALAVWFWLPLAVVMVVSAVIHVAYPDRRWYVYQERNLLWIVYPFAAIVMLGAVAAGDWLARRLGSWCRAIVPGALILVALGTHASIMTLRRNDWTIYKPNPAWRDAAEWIRLRSTDAAGNPSRPVCIEYATTPCDPISYYLPEAERVVSPDGSDIRRTAAAVWTREPEGTAQAFLLSQLHWWPLGNDWVMEGASSGLYRVAETACFDGLVIYHLRPPE